MKVNKEEKNISDILIKFFSNKLIELQDFGYPLIHLKYYYLHFKAIKEKSLNQDLLIVFINYIELYKTYILIKGLDNINTNDFKDYILPTIESFLLKKFCYMSCLYNKDLENSKELLIFDKKTKYEKLLIINNFQKLKICLDNISNIRHHIRDKIKFFENFFQNIDNNIFKEENKYIQIIEILDNLIYFLKNIDKRLKNLIKFYGDEF